MKKFIFFLLSVIFGAFGFIATRFYFQPILKYKELKFQINSDLIFYKNAITHKPLKFDVDFNKRLEQKVLNRMDANRRHSADLDSCCYDVPFFYLIWKGEHPDKASVKSMILSNTIDPVDADKLINEIRNFLKIKLKAI